jgi:predicted MFS family arabinose efflux permease
MLQRPNLTQRHYGFLALLVVAHFGHHLLTALLVPLTPFLRDEFALSYAQTGWLVSAFTIAYGISQLPTGWLADRIGQRSLITIGISGVAFSGLLVGLAPNYLFLAIFLVLLGIAAGGYHPAAAPLVSASVAPQNRGRALGIHQIGGSASYFVAPLIAIALTSVIGWRGSFIGLAVPVAILGLALYVLLGRQQYRQITSGETDSTTESAASGRRRSLATFLALAIISETTIWAIIAFVPLFLTDQAGVTEGRAGALLALAYSGGLWASPLGGYLCDRWGRVMMLVFTSLIAGVIIYLLTLAAYGWILFALLIALGMSAFFLIPVSEAYLISRAPRQNRSTILGVYYVGSVGGPGLIAPIIGHFIDRTGFDSSFAVVSLLLFAITLACAFVLWKDRS